MATTTRKRSIVYIWDIGKRWTQQSNGTITGVSTGSRRIGGGQTTVSEGHPFKHSFEGRDLGGNFLSTRQFPNKLAATTVESTTTKTYDLTGTPNQLGTVDRYQGPVYPVDPDTFAACYPASSEASDDATLWAYGGTAIKRCKPGQPVADLAVSLAELYREGIPKFVGHSFWEDRARSLGRNAPKNGSAEYLSWVFGWSPIISEVKNVASFIQTSDDLMKQYERDSGKMIRRSYNFPIEVERTEALIDSSARPYGTHAGTLKTSMFLNDVLIQGALYRITEKKRERWFSGAFTYYLPDSYYSRTRWIRNATKAKVFLGLEITPEVIWNLTPWSWAADWFANTGDVLSNVSDFAGNDLAMHYGYIMEKSTVTYTYELRHHGLRGVPDPLTMSFSNETKRRIKASPFGFGLTWDGFSPKQLSILAALGINRAL